MFMQALQGEYLRREHRKIEIVFSLIAVARV